MYCKGIVPDVCKEKKKIFVFSAARFIISEWLMTRNYPDIITYVFCKKRFVTIHTISGGFGGGGESNSARKAYARQLDDFEVYSVQKPPKSQKYNPLIVGFSSDDYDGVSLPHTDALVVTLIVANY
jgi:hypothetical protein